MPTQLILPIILMALFGGYTLYTIRKRKAAMPDATRRFLEQTGYRYADILDQPLEAHIHHGEQLVKNARSDGYRVHMVRDYYGAPIHSIQDYRYERKGTTTTTSMSYTWTLPLAQQPRIPFQVADKSLGSFGKAVKEAFSSSERHWEPAYPVQVQIGDPELDQRFNFFGYDENAVRWAIQQPGMRDLLLGCAEVDLTVHPDRVTFADPLQKNMRAGMGGTVGMMAMSTDVDKMMQLTIPIHDRMAQLLATSAQSACPPSA